MWTRSQRYPNLNWKFTFYTDLRESPIIKETDTKEEAQEKLNKVEENFLRLQSTIDEKMLEVVYMLDLFDGKLSLSEILNLEIPLLNHLRKAKQKINDEINKKNRAK